MLGPEVHDGTTDLEKILGDILRFPSEFTSVSVDEEVLFLLFHKSVKLHRLSHDCVLVYKMKLIKDIYQIDLV